MTPVYVPWAIGPRESAFCGYCKLNIWPSMGHRCVVVLLPGHGMYAHETCAVEHGCVRDHNGLLRATGETEGER